jgi:phage gpG-like protein
MVDVVIRIDAEKAAAALNAFGVRGFSDLMATAGTLVRGQTVHRIASEKTSPDGAAWPPLKASTIRQKRGSTAILQDKGWLMGGIGMNHGANWAEVFPGGGAAPYAGFLQGGTSRMPAREFMGISEENFAQIKLAVDAWVEGQF